MHELQLTTILPTAKELTEGTSLQQTTAASRHEKISHLTIRSCITRQHEMNFNIAVCAITCFRPDTRHDTPHARQTWLYKIQNLCYVFQHNRKQDTPYAQQALRVKIQHQMRSETTLCITSLRAISEECSRKKAHHDCRTWEATVASSFRQTLATYNNMTELLFERGDAQRRRCPGRPTTAVHLPGQEHPPRALDATRTPPDQTPVRWHPREGKRLTSPAPRISACPRQDFVPPKT